MKINLKSKRLAALSVVIVAIVVFQLDSRDISRAFKTTASFFSFGMTTPFTTPPQAATSAFSFTSGPGGPILIIASGLNPFSRYYAEIIRTEGFNAFAVHDISSVSPEDLGHYDVIILGEMPLTTAQVKMLDTWVQKGGHLIAMRPDKKLAGLLGLTDLSSSISDAYLLINTSSGPGEGIVNQTIQYHGAADRYGLNGASTIATLYSAATTATPNPAITLKHVGTNGGQVAAFTYDLARSVIYTRQGNPAWSGQERDKDNDSVIRSDDMFYGAANLDPKPDWVDLSKVAIPQADEQQRLLANLIIRMNSGKKPLPRFWYFPRSLAAVVVMTGDDHGGGGTAGRFDRYKSLRASGCSVDNWECIRGTSYIFTNTPISNSQAFSYNSAGFEVALHVDTDCSDWTPSLLESFYSGQLNAWNKKYSSLPSPATSRTHCIAWSDYATQALVELKHGIRFDTNYYYWPAKWVNNRPGFFTGSGIPMRFGNSDGNPVDVYQAPTQMTDESGQAYPFTVDTLLDKATGPEGYYGAFVANMHTDKAESSPSDAIVRSAIARGIPVISARQMLEWLDGRNASTFNSLKWNGNTLSFSITVAQHANGLVAMAPMTKGHNVARITRNGRPVDFTVTTVKGIRYAAFIAANGAYRVNYAWLR